MSMGPLHSLASAAGAPFAQRHGGDVERSNEAQSQQAAQQRLDRTDQGDAALDDSQGVGDRDADGRDYGGAAERRLPETEGEEQAASADETQAEATSDPEGKRGSRLDLTG